MSGIAATAVPYADRIVAGSVASLRSSMAFMRPRKGVRDGGRSSVFERHAWACGGQPIAMGTIGVDA